MGFLEFLRHVLGDWLWLVLNLINGFFLYRLARPFLPVRDKWWWRGALLLLFAGSSGMVIWVGDPNLLYTFPVFLTVFFLCTRGNWVGRLAMCLAFFCLEMPVCALVDTYLEFVDAYDVVVRLVRPVLFSGLYLLLRRGLPEEPVALPRRLWRLILGLAAMPFCALMAVVLLTYTKYDSSAAYSMAMNLGIVVLPFVLLTAVMILRAVLVLSDHERLERAGQLAGLREVYYQGLRQQETQVRQLRHDLRNHLTAVEGLLEQGKTREAAGYLSEIAGSPALRGTKRFCDNEVANVVLSAKAEEMTREGITADFAVSLSKDLPLADTDLCALLGNALDNAREGVQGCREKKVVLRCRLDKGLFMLRLENPTANTGESLATTKADKESHGFGIPGMREIAQRCNGSLDAGIRDGRFELVVCIPIEQ